MSHLRSAALAAMLPVVVCMLVSCKVRREYLIQDGLIWNTSYHIVFEGTESLTDSVVKTLEEVGKSLSVFDKNSLVSQVNASDSVVVDSHFKRVWSISDKIWKESGGYFDPTLSPLITAWGFGPGHTATPDTARVDSILRFVGLNLTYLQDDMLIKKHPGVQFNFSAVAKGYACDAVGEMLSRNGVKNWLVEIGGEIATKGKGPSGLWTISVDKPIFSPYVPIHERLCAINLRDSAVATSGNYRNLRKGKNGNYGHTISPTTGRPVQTDVISATVVARTCGEADAYATACMAMGFESAKKMLAKRKLPAMLVMMDSTVWISPEFDAIIHKDFMKNGGGFIFGKSKRALEQEAK